MTATLILVRHAPHEQIGQRLSGRMPNLGLGSEGLAQARRAAKALEGAFDAVQSSPVQRARETAEAIAAGRGLPVEIAPALEEIDFGAWTGRTFDELEGDRDWRIWNERRGSARAPGGESMAEVQARVAAHLAGAARANQGRRVVMVSHCDVIRAAVAQVLGLPLDRLLAFDVDPASATRIVAGDWGARLLSLNERLA